MVLPIDDRPGMGGRRGIGAMRTWVDGEGQAGWIGAARHTAPAAQNTYPASSRITESDYDGHAAKSRLRKQSVRRKINKTTI